MRQNHDPALTPEQMVQAAASQDKVIDKQKRLQERQADHLLRKWCVEMAIKAIDASPDFNCSGSGTITNYFNLEPAKIAESIYYFVHAPLDAKDE